MSQERYDRQTKLFGKEGQKKLEGLNVAIVGVGGLGTHVVQQLAYLGINSFYLIDDEVIDKSNLNRYVGVSIDDIGKYKVNIVNNVILKINPDASVSSIPNTLQSEEAFKGILKSDCAFGCLDNEGSRLILNELSSAYEIPYFDLASEIYPGEEVYGGRLCISLEHNGCLDCLGYIDREEANKDLESSEARKDREDIYGLDDTTLGDSGPSVVSINGVVASLAVTEFMVWATGLRRPQNALTYRGDQSKVYAATDKRQSDCYFCSDVRGKGDEAYVQRYLN